MDRNHSFGYWLQRRRKALDLTQAELAQQVGCAVTTIKKIEADERRPSRQLAARLADRLALAPEERVAFLKAARAELAADRLEVAIQPMAPRPAAAPLRQPTASLPTGTVTFLFTDIAGSTRLWEQHPAAMPAALARHDALLRAAIVAHGGAVFKAVGDAVCAAFARAADALAAALDAQRALQAEDWSAIGLAPAEHPQGVPLRVRMALHTGAAEERGGDYFGPPLNRVARLLAVGHGGQTLLSRATEQLLRDHLPPGVELRDLGTHRLKDLTRPEQIFQLVATDLPDVFPALTTLDMRPHNLPAQPTALIGREREIAALGELLRRADVRLVTLTGPGGTGKTRLALQTAADLLDAESPPPLSSQRERGSGGEGRFPNGVWFVNLAPIGDPALVATTIAQTLGVRETGGQPLRDSLRAYLHARQLLLVLDNFEQVLDAAPLVTELLAAAPRLKLLITSREMLHLYGEHEFAVPPLGLPPRQSFAPHSPAPLPTQGQGEQDQSPAHDRPLSLAWERGLGGEGDLTQYEAVRLFIARARAAKADFVVTNATAPAVAEICYRLDGLPLAIELAAARIKLFAPEALLARLAQRLTLLTGGPRDLPARHQTLRGAIDWSYHLLDAREQTLFARLGVFVGGCTLAAASAVLSSELSVLSSDLHNSELSTQNSERDILDGLAALADKSLLRQDEGAEGEPRFVMLETIREYALERLEMSGEAAAIRRQHADSFLALAETAEPRLRSTDQELWLDRLAAEHDNLRAALAWLLDHDPDVALRLAAALWWYWEVHGHFTEGRRWLEETLARGSGTAAAVRARALLGAGRLAGLLGDDNCQARLAEGLELARAIGDQWLIAFALSALAFQMDFQGSHEQAQAQHAESLARARTLGDPWLIAIALMGSGIVAVRQGAHGWARALFEEALAFARTSGNKRWIASALTNLGWLALRQGDYEQVRALYAESLPLLWTVGDKVLITAALLDLAIVAAAQDQPERAARLLGALEAQAAATGEHFWPDERAEFDRAVAATCTQLDEATFAAAWAAGRALTFEQAIAEALAGTAAAEAQGKHP